MPAWKAGLMANMKQSTMPSLNVMLISISDAVISFIPCLPTYTRKPYAHFMGKMTVVLLQDFSSTAGEKGVKL